MALIPMWQALCPLWGFHLLPCSRPPTNTHPNLHVVPGISAPSPSLLWDTRLSEDKHTSNLTPPVHLAAGCCNSTGVFPALWVSGLREPGQPGMGQGAEAGLYSNARRARTLAKEKTGA